MTQKARKIPTRARSPEAKSARKAVILAAALKLFSTRSLELISMNEIATAAGVAKGTLYLYFATKEEIFLSLMRECYEVWFDRLDLALNAGLAWRALPAWIAQELEREPKFLRLLCLLHAVLERNLEPASAREFKIWLAQRLQSSAQVMAARFTHLQVDRCELLLMQVQCIAVGAAQMARPSEVMCKVLQETELARLKIEFRPFFEATLAGLCASLQT